MKIQLPDFSNTHILVIGDVMLDRYWHGQASRISPEAPVPVVHINHTEERPGGAGNVALNVAALGVQTKILGITGDDVVADTLENQLKAAQVNTKFHRVPGMQTVTKLRVLSRHQQLVRCDFESTVEDVTADKLLDEVRNALEGVKAVILSDYAKGTLSQAPAIIALLKQHNIPVFIDPKTADFSAYDGATLITPNLKEFEAVVGACKTEKDIVDKAHALLAKHHIDAVLITRGAEGMTLITKAAEEFHLPARVRDVFDVTGAGDTVIAMMATAVSCGKSLQESMAIANIAAGLVVTKLGAATVSVPELQMAILDKSPAESGLLNESHLLLAVKEARARGERVVMTNGCFDILHAGHVTYLQQAKALGHRLIVAVNSDDSVQRLKGVGRPVNPCDQRMLVLASLGVVDWVVPFSEDTPERLITKVLPDVLVKGGDYKADEIAGAKAVKANGGDVKILSFVDGLSTSNVIKKLKGDA